MHAVSTCDEKLFSVSFFLWLSHDPGLGKWAGEVLGLGLRPVYLAKACRVNIIIHKSQGASGAPGTRVRASVTSTINAFCWFRSSSVGPVPSFHQLRRHDLMIGCHLFRHLSFVQLQVIFGGGRHSTRVARANQH